MQKKVWILIIAIIVVTLGGAFLWMQKSKTPTTNIQNSTTQTADWKTYSNTEYGFEMKYPKDVTVLQDENTIKVHDTRHGYAFDWNMKFYKNNSKEELKTWINSQFNLLNQPSNKDCKIVPADKYGLKVNIKDAYTVLIDAPSYGASCAHIGYYTLSSNNLTVMEFDSVQASPELYQDILSTFKFTDAQVQNQNTEPLIAVTSPNKGEMWKIGETHNIIWNPGLFYEAGCHNSIWLEDENGNNVGAISDGLLRKGQISLTWNTKDMSSLSCGTGAEPVMVKPGIYRIRVDEEGDGGNLPDINAYSNYFSIVNP